MIDDQSIFCPKQQVGGHLQHIILRNVAYCCYGPFFPWSSCFLASFVFRGSLRRSLKSPNVVHVVMEHGCLSRRSRTTCHASQHVMCIEEEPGDRTRRSEWVLTQLHDHYLEEEEEPYKLSSNRLLMCMFLLKLSETDSVGVELARKHQFWQIRHCFLHKWERDHRPR